MRDFINEAEDNDVPTRKRYRNINLRGKLTGNESEFKIKWMEEYIRKLNIITNQFDFNQQGLLQKIYVLESED